MAPITAQLVRAEGEKLMALEGSEYYSLEVVYRITRDGDLIYYSTLLDWLGTEIGRVAHLMEEIDALQARNKELEERIAILSDFQKDALPDLEPAESPTNGLQCSCGKTFKDYWALSVHKRRAAIHKGES